MPYDYATSLAAIRDNLVQELQNETARRLALTAAGNPPPVNYTVRGRTTDWTGYLAVMQKLIRDANADVLAAGGDGGLYEERVRGYT